MAYGLLYDFLYGQTTKAYEYFGAHFVKINNKEGCMFRVYAPRAKEISVIGEFNNWDPGIDVMRKIDDSGVFEIFVPGVREYQSYKYHILTCGNYWVDKADPYGFLSEYKPGSCSRTFKLEDFIWHDEEWLKKIKRINFPIQQLV